MVGVSRVGSYELRGSLGQGASATVYRAWDPRLQREVALKLFPPDAGPGRQAQRSAREAEALARLTHPHVVRVHTVGEHEGRRYLVMDLVAGQSLADVLEQEGPLPPERAIEVTIQVAEALQAAHDQQLLHRDLKPGNVLLRDDGAALLTDFGLAKDLAAPSQSLSQSGQFLGSPGYWPPEQARGEVRSLDARADVYGLGATLYALLTGRPPLEAPSLVQALAATLHQEPTPPRALDPRIPAWLSDVCLRCLRKDPAQRYPSAAALAAALRERVAPRSQRRGLWLTTLLLVLTVGVGGAAAYLARPAATRPGPSPAATIAGPEDPVTSARERFLERLLAGDVAGAQAALEELGGSPDYQHLSPALALELRQATARRSAALDESRLMVLSPADREAFLREALGLVDECQRLDPEALGELTAPLLSRCLDTLAELLFVVQDTAAAGDVDEAQLAALTALCERAPGSLGAAKLELALALQSSAYREAWSAAQPVEPHPDLASPLRLLRAHLLARDWRIGRPADAVEVGDAALAPLAAEPRGLRITAFVRNLRQDLAQAHLAVGLERLRAGDAAGLDHVEACYRLGYQSFSAEPLVAPAWREADERLEVPPQGLGGYDYKTVVRIYVALLVGRQYAAAERMITARKGRENQQVLRAELALLRDGPQAALEASSQDTASRADGWGLRAHALRLLGRADEAEQAYAQAAARRDGVGIPWHQPGPWCRALVAGEDVWWPGAE